MYIRILPQENIQYAEYMMVHHLQWEPLSIVRTQENQEPVTGYIITPVTVIIKKNMKKYGKNLIA